MNSEDRFWISGMLIILATVLVVTALCVVNAMHRRTIALDMVKAGASPLEASCALDIPDTNSVCMIAKR